MTRSVLAPALAMLTHAITAATACNGHAELCDRRYSNMTFIGSHDSAFVGTSVADNQEISVADQLAQGVRFLQAQTHLANDNNMIELCHTLCLLEDAGPLTAYLSTIKTFLDDNPQEVVTLLLTNQDGLSGTVFDAAFRSSGARGYAYTPAEDLTLEQWPTLGQMISMGQRLVVFMDFPAGPPVPYILDEFHSFIFETPFDTTDPAFPQCAIDRPPGASAAGRMILVNHFLDTNLSGILIPNRAAANVTNSAASITAQANLCSSLYQQTPNFILLDWISTGDAMSVQAMMNGVPFTAETTTTTTTAGEPPSASAAGSMATSTRAQFSTAQSLSGIRVGSRSPMPSQLAAMIALLFAMTRHLVP